MLRKSLAILGLASVSALPALAGSSQPDSLIAALESNYHVPRVFFTANTTENVIAPDAQAPVAPLNYVQRYCRDGRKLDVRVEAVSDLAANAASQFERLVMTPTTRVAVRTPETAGAPVVEKPTAEAEARKVALDLLHGGEALDGYLAGDREPLPQVLRAARSLKVRPETEEVGGHACVVVEATSKHGLYTVWVDEAEGATVRKAEVIKNNGDQYRDLPRLGAMTVDGAPVARTRFTMDNVAVERINGKVIPVSARMETTYTLADGRTQTVQREHTRTGMDLNPDFGAMDAFKVEPALAR